MKVNDQIQLIASILGDLIAKLPPKEAQELSAKLRALHHDGRSLSWDPDRKSNHGAKLRDVWEAKKAEESFFLRRNDEVTELKGMDAVVKVLGIKPQSIRCQLSVGNGVAIYSRNRSQWFLTKTREQAQEAHMAKFYETGNPDDIIQDRHAGLRRMTEQREARKEAARQLALKPATTKTTKKK